MRHIISYGTDLFYLFVIDIFASYIMGVKWISRRMRIGGLVCFMVIYNLLSYKLYPFKGLMVVIAVIWHLLVFFVFYKGRFKENITAVLFLEIANMVSEVLLYLLFLLFDINSADIRNMTMESALAGSAISKIIIFIFVKWYILIYKMVRKRQVHSFDCVSDVSISDFIETVTVPLGSVVILIHMISYSEVNLMWTWICLTVLIINIFSYDQYSRLKINMVNAASFYGLKKLYDALKKYTGSMSKKWNELRGLRHDMRKDNMLALLYLERGDLENLKAHYQKLCDMAIFGRQETGNWLFDMLVSQARLQSEKYDIQFTYEINIPLDIRLDEFRINRLFGNILDNGIEAAMKCPDGSRWMNLMVKMHGNNMYIACENTCVWTSQGNKTDRIQKYSTTKADRENHGYGIKIIKEIVNFYHGNMKLEQKPQRFSVKIILYDVVKSTKIT